MRTFCQDHPRLQELSGLRPASNTDILYGTSWRCFTETFEEQMPREAYDVQALPRNLQPRLERKRATEELKEWESSDYGEIPHRVHERQLAQMTAKAAGTYQSRPTIQHQNLLGGVNRASRHTGTGGQRDPSARASVAPAEISEDDVHGSAL